METGAGTSPILSVHCIPKLPFFFLLCTNSQLIWLALFTSSSSSAFQSASHTITIISMRHMGAFRSKNFHTLIGNTMRMIEIRNDGKYRARKRWTTKANIIEYKKKDENCTTLPRNKINTLNNGVWWDRSFPFIEEEDHHHQRQQQQHKKRIRWNEIKQWWWTTLLAKWNGKAAMATATETLMITAKKNTQQQHQHSESDSCYIDLEWLACYPKNGRYVNAFKLNDKNDV